MAQKVSELMTSAPVLSRSGQLLADGNKAMRGAGDVEVADDGVLNDLVTDRDVVVHAVPDGCGPGTISVAETSSQDLGTGAPDDAADTAVRRMREHAVRWVPVVQRGRPAGVLPAGDMAAERDERSALAGISAQPPDA